VADRVSLEKEQWQRSRDCLPEKTGGNLDETVIGRQLDTHTPSFADKPPDGFSPRYFKKEPDCRQVKFMLLLSLQLQPYLVFRSLHSWLR